MPLDPDFIADCPYGPDAICIDEVVEIDRPLADRGLGDPELEAHQKHLWTLMRDEARAADSELLDA